MLWNTVRPNSFSARGWLTVIILLLFVFSLTSASNAFPRKPLFEDFTSTTCPPCAALAPIQAAAFAQLEENDEVVPIAYHMNWPAPGDDPWYADNPTDNNGKRGYYGINGVPTILIDGTVSNARTQAAIVDAIRNRAQVNSPLQISLDGRIVGGELTVNVRVEAESAVNNVRLNVALNEIYYRYDAYSEWWDHYDMMVKMIPDYNGTVISVSPDEPYEHEFVQSMNGLGWHDLEMDNLMIVAFAQDANRNILQANHFRLGIDSPAIEFLDWSITDTDEGDGDGRPEPGETAHFVFNMENAANYLPAETVDVTLSTEDAGISIVAGEFHLDGLENGDQGSNSASPFRFTVAEDFIAHPVTFNLSLVAAPGDYMIDETITIMVDWPPFLLVDAANNQNAGDHLRNAFGRDPLPWYDVWDRNTDGPMVDDVLIEQYDVVLWHTFNNVNDAIIDFEADILTGYLENGGTLVMSSAYLPGQLGNHRLFTQYLAAEVDMENAGGSVNYVRGVENDPHFDGAFMFLGGTIGFPTSRMSFRATDNATAVLNYEDSNHANRGIAAIKHEAGTYRTLLLGFPLETITGTIRGTDSLITFTDHIWNWVQNTPDSAPDDEMVPLEFSLNNAYPNPFNAQTVINYSVAKNEAITLKLFDVAGREVATLLDGMAQAGSHSLSVNAVDLGLESGIYYARLESASETMTSKIVYLK